MWELQASNGVTSLVTADSRLALAALKADRDPWGPAMSFQSLCWARSRGVFTTRRSESALYSAHTDKLIPSTVLAVAVRLL